MYLNPQIHESITHESLVTVSGRCGHWGVELWVGALVALIVIALAIVELLHPKQLNAKL